jgi:hypothetical protein
MMIGCAHLLPNKELSRRIADALGQRVAGVPSENLA